MNVVVIEALDLILTILAHVLLFAMGINMVIIGRDLDKQHKDEYIMTTQAYFLFGIAMIVTAFVPWVATVSWLFK